MRRPSPRSPSLVRLAAAVLAALPPVAVRAQDAAHTQLQDAQHTRAAAAAEQADAAARARAAAAEEVRLGEARAAAAAKLRVAEVATAEQAAKMDALARRRQDAERRLQDRADALVPLLPLIERLSLYPAETLLAVPAAPDAALRGVLVLAGIGHQLERDAAALRQEQAEVAALVADMARASPALAAAQAAQAAQAAALDQQIEAARSDRHAEEDAAAAAERRAAAAGARADSLRAAIAQIETQRQQAELRAQRDAARAERQRHAAEAADAHARVEALAQPGGPGLADPTGQLTAPVAGTLVRAWGEATDAGPATGLSYQAPPAARVVSPCAGRIVFAGPFRSYGLLLIVDCGGGYDFVLAGLDRLDTNVGAKVQSGEPVGVMPSWDPHIPGNRPALYLELRRDGQAVNPAPWLKGRG